MVDSETMTGLSRSQLMCLEAQLATRVNLEDSDGGAFALNLFDSMVAVIYILKSNSRQVEVAAIFGVSQPTISRRWSLLRDLIRSELARFVPDPAQVAGQGSVLVDGTICPTWDWKSRKDLYSGKTGYPGFNIQLAASVNGELLAVGPIPVPGARHDAYAYAASGLARKLATCHTVADLGYRGVTGINLTPKMRPAGGQLHEMDRALNHALSAARAAVERAVATLKHWRILSEEGGRCRYPLDQYQSILATCVALHFYTAHE